MSYKNGTYQKINGPGGGGTVNYQRVLMDILIEMTKFNNFFDHSRSIYNNVKKLKNFGEKNSLKKSKNKKKIWGGGFKKK